MNNESLLVTLPQLARRYGVPASWLKAEADSGRLPAVRAGSQRLFNLEVVELVLAERAAQRTLEAADDAP